MEELGQWTFLDCSNFSANLSTIHSELVQFQSGLVGIGCEKTCLDYTKKLDDPRFPKELIEQVDHWSKQAYSPSHPEKALMRRNIRSFHYFRLLGGPLSVEDFTGARHKDWQVDPERVPYIADLIQQLPLKDIQEIVYLSLPEGAFGPFHLDTKPEDEIFTFNIVVNSANVPLVVVNEDTKYEIRAEKFIFSTAMYHGVPPIPLGYGDRVVLRVDGKLDQIKLKEWVKRDLARKNSENTRAKSI